MVQYVPDSTMAITRIVFRAFQGLGGGGCFSLGTIVTTELVPPDQLTTATARLSISVSLGLLLGPIIGGVIAASTTWRWIFIIKYEQKPAIYMQF
jgi:MFS family permease